MGSKGHVIASYIEFRPNEVILEIGAERGEGSTNFLSKLGPLLVSVDPDSAVYEAVRHIPNVEAHLGVGEQVLQGWNRPIGFAWLDGHDWPYSGNPPNYYNKQRAGYLTRGQDYSQEASRKSHLEITKLIAPFVRFIGFDDTWPTHEFKGDGEECQALVGLDLKPCGHLKTHPHHETEMAWNGKGGTAVPYLLTKDFKVVENEHYCVLLSAP